LRYDRSNYNAGFLSSIFFVVGSRGSPFSVTSLSQPSTTADPRTRGSVRRSSGFVQIARTLVDRGSERYGRDCFNAEKPAVPKSFGGTLADGFQRCLPQPRVTLYDAALRSRQSSEIRVGCANSARQSQHGTVGNDSPYWLSQADMQTSGEG
jgi:hypothetical protein